MRVLHVIPSYLPAYRYGGPIVAVHGLCKALAERGHQVDVFTTDIDGPGRLSVPLSSAVPIDGVHVWYYPVGSPRRLHRAPAMTAALKARVPESDVVHLHSVFLWPTFAAARAAERAGVPYVVSPRGMLVSELLARRGRLRKRLWLRLVERRTLARAAAIHCTSRLEVDEARRTGIRLAPQFIVPNGVQPATEPDFALASAPVRAALLRHPFVLALGRLSWKKGLDRLISALPMIPSATAVVAGPDEGGCRQQLEALALSLGVRDRTIFLDAVAGNDKAALLAACDVFALPSHSENFGNVVLEAMAAGRAVVVTPEVGVADELLASGTGIITAGTPEALAETINELLGDPERATKLGRRASDYVAEQFTWPAVAARMEARYREIAA